MNGQCHVHTQLSSTSCSVHMAGPLLLPPGSSFQTGEQVQLTAFYHEWLTGMWNRVKQKSLMLTKGWKKSSLHQNEKMVIMLILNFDWKTMHRQLFLTLALGSQTKTTFDLSRTFLPLSGHSLTLSYEERGKRAEAGLRIGSKTVIFRPWRKRGPNVFPTIGGRQSRDEQES